ncbi:MAG: amidophosphoribosyltransferase, partial [Parvibaculaceae bacterium]|nr:amidophosphoribosyltransferase [Parvibaculaceae bacterium]
DREQLLAAQYDLEGMRKYISVDSLAFISVDGLYRSMGQENGRNDEDPQYTDHCFTGDYPTQLTDVDQMRKSDQLSLLAEIA